MKARIFVVLRIHIFNPKLCLAERLENVSARAFEVKKRRTEKNMRVRTYGMVSARHSPQNAVNTIIHDNNYSPGGAH